MSTKTKTISVKKVDRSMSPETSFIIWQIDDVFKRIANCFSETIPNIRHDVLYSMFLETRPGDNLQSWDINHSVVLVRLDYILTIITGTMFENMITGNFNIDDGFYEVDDSPEKNSNEKYLDHISAVSLDLHDWQRELRERENDNCNNVVYVQIN